MKNLISLLSILGLLLFNGCQQNRSSQNNNQNQSDTIVKQENDIADNEIDMKIKSGDYFDLINENYEGKEKLLSYVEQQKKKDIEYGRTASFIPYDVESLPLILPVTSICLRKAGYIPPTESDYQRQISKYFKMDRIGRKIMDHMPLFYEYEMYDDDGYESMLNSASFFFSPKYRLVYKYVQDDRAVGSNLFSEPEVRYYSYLTKQTVHMNQFIFHDSNASLTWLINNSPEFLEMLLTEAGYDENPRINEMVLAKRLEKLEAKNYHDAFRSLFVDKDVNTQKLIFHEELLKYIVETSTPETPQYPLMLAKYAELTISDDEQGRQFQEMFSSKEERYKIAAYMGYYEKLARNKNNIDKPEDLTSAPTIWWWGFFRNELVQNEDFLKEMKKHNYYNLPDLEDIVAGILHQIEFDNERAANRILVPAK